MITGTFFSIRLYILCINMLFFSLPLISFMSNKLFLILNHWYVSAHTDEH